MKIAMVSDHAGPLPAPGGANARGQHLHVEALSSALARAGHQVVVYTRRDDPGLPARVEIDEGVIVEHVPAGPTEPISKDDVYPHIGQLATRLQSRWRRFRPDVVHAHFWMSGLACLQAARPLGLPVVQTFHELGVVQKRYEGCHDASPRDRIAVEAAICRRADRIVATCTVEMFELLEMGADRDRISIVPCAVDTCTLTPKCPASPRTAQLARQLGCQRGVGLYEWSRIAGAMLSAYEAVVSGDLIGRPALG